jgi:hypothetical protein
MQARLTRWPHLYVPDGRFDRLGQQIVGRDAIRQVIAGRPPGVWTKHVCSNVRIDVAPDALTATGRVDLDMERGQQGIDKVDKIRAEYFDQFVLTDEGWRFAVRKVVMR